MSKPAKFHRITSTRLGAIAARFGIATATRVCKVAQVGYINALPVDQWVDKSHATIKHGNGFAIYAVR